jgi:hypothetical protein
MGFPKHTLVQTDQGLVPIQDIDGEKHTIYGEAVVGVTSAVSDERVVCFTKDAFKPGYPSAPTFMSPHHTLFFLGRMVPAETFVGKFQGVGVLEGYDQPLYDVVMPQHRLMSVNQLICETGYLFV